MMDEINGKIFIIIIIIIIRPDQFTYAACSSLEESQRAAKSVPQAVTIVLY